MAFDQDMFLTVVLGVLCAKAIIFTVTVAIPTWINFGFKIARNFYHFIKSQNTTVIN